MSVCLCLLLESGCGKGPPREGLGGGASTPVSVRLLLDEAPEREIEPAESATGEKVTEFGTFKGRVHVAGSESELKKLTPQDRVIPAGKSSKAGVIPDRSVLVGPDSGLANVIIFLAQLPNAEIPPSPAEAVMVDFKESRFTPPVSIIRVGQPLILTNSEKSTLDVSIESATKSFKATLPGGRSRNAETTYSDPEPYPVQITSAGQPRRIASQLVVSHPWAAVTAEDGTFEIRNAPAGTWKYHVWHEKLGRLSPPLEVTIPANETLEQEIPVHSRDLLAP